MSYGVRYDNTKIYLVLYKNMFNEIRPMIIDANSNRDCEGIIQARRLNSVAYFKLSELIQLFNKRRKD